jgi:hypothetical protein
MCDAQPQPRLPQLILAFILDKEEGAFFLGVGSF